ncbi:MAG: TolC family protein [Bacteroidota bacterium]|nr:TolC family protein [Bacteroidota bacterium]
MKIRIIILFLLSVICSEVRAQERKVWTLEQLVQYGISNSPLIKIAGMKTEEAGYKIQEIKSKQLPQLNGSANLQNTFMNMRLKIPAAMVEQIPDQYMSIIQAIENIDKLYGLSGGLQLSQILFNSQLRIGIQSARTAEELNRLSGNIEKESLIYEIASNYYQVLLNQSQMDVIESNLQNLKQVEDNAALLYKNDMGKKTDLDRIKVNITNLQTQRTKLSNGIKMQLNYLKVLTGMPIDNNLDIDRKDIDRINQIAEKDLSVFSPEQRTEYQALLSQKKLAELDHKNDKAAYQPTLAAFGQMNYQSYNTKFSFNQWNGTKVIGLSLSIPIYDGGEKRYKIKQANSKINQLQEEIKQKTNMMEIEYRDAVEQLKTNYEALKAQEANKKLAADVYHQTELLYKEGMATLTDLLNAEVSLREAQNAYNQHVLDFKVANLNLLKAQGKLDTIIQ